ncbi:uncharacterized protein LOC119069730 [Bradysia coprophila]|uniref:uncharacterized protein LOC119069730 n=1 Tax=Bradysia coprophila TaxID=38358 RepID=UPI00187D73F6|nr:uncharacterized protein LOC119069730 [Bradysia coprophila]
MLFKFCRKKKHETKPGEILDQVISQSSSTANQCLLYKLANYKRGGDLIDAFQTGGQLAVENLIREQFGVFMYNNGKGQMINRAEYLRWKYRDNKEVVIPIEASLSPHDPLGKWVDHKAGWQMQYRGSLGESLLHVLIICDTKVHTKLARILLRVFSILALDVMEGEEYLGASALHLAIAYSNNELVQDLIEAGANVNQRATGSFFLPRDQQGYRPAKNTDYEGLAYLGEYPLAWAACCANESVYNLLLDSGADPDAQDTFGNMILHMVVVCDKLDMFGYALRHPKLPAKNGIINDSGLTPLTLACKLGRAEVFREMLELSSREFWRYSNITCSGYPLNALDTLLPDGRTNWNSALFIILNGTKEEHLDMLDGGIIQRLLEEKWKTFARNQFLKRLLILFIHLFFLSISMYLRPITENLSSKAQNEEDDLLNAESTSECNEAAENVDEMDIQAYIRYGSEVCTLLGVLSYVIFQQGDEIKNQGLAAFTKQLVHAPAKAIFLISNILILACIPFRMIGDNDTEEAILVFAVPGSWFLLMFFAGAVRLTGPFVTMIYSMITGDMFTFGIIYLIVLFGFSQAFYFLYKGHPQVKSSLFYTYPSTWMALFQTTLGDYSYSDLNNTTYPNLAKTVFVIFMIFVPILLLNMLIAMMGNTYAHVIEQSEKEWMKQWAKIVVTLERAVSQTDAQKYLEAYSIPLGPSDDSGYETRGVMVIKSKSKTRAKQRKGAVSNWKRVGRVTLNALSKRGLTGEELRRIMWGRASISSPTKEPKKKVRDPNDPFGVTSGGALSSAVDVMSFAHDIVMCNDTVNTSQTKDVQNRSSAQQITQPSLKNEMAMSQPMAAGNVNPSSNQQQISQANTTMMAQNNFPCTQTVEKDYKDPLRELVLISEAICINDTAYLTNVKSLAKEATVLEHVKEVLPEQAGQMPASPAPLRPHPIPAPTEMQNISTMFTDPKDIVDPIKEKEFMRKLQALEDTDSECFDEKPVLGKISLIRRAKSAVSRTASAKKTNDKHPLFHVAWEEQINYDQKNVPAKQPNGITNMVFMDDATEQDEIVTIEEVKRQTELFHLRKGSPLEGTKIMDEKTGKYVKARKSKTSRNNKVSPTDETGDTRKHKRGRSANSSKFRTESPPDPLENWSTKDLANINQILKDN